MIFFGLLLLLLQIVDGSTVLLMPLEHHAHMGIFINVGKALINKGHDVHLITTDKHRERIDKSGIKPLLHTRINGVGVFDDPELADIIIDLVLGKTNKVIALKKLMNKVQFRLIEVFEEMMKNKILLEQLRSEKFDLAIMDGEYPARIFYIIPYKYNIPVITLSSVLSDPWDSNVPAILSVEPFIGENELLPKTNKCNSGDSIPQHEVFDGFQT